MVVIYYCYCCCIYLSSSCCFVLSIFIIKKKSIITLLYHCYCCFLYLNLVLSYQCPPQKKKHSRHYSVIAIVVVSLYLHLVFVLLCYQRPPKKTLTPLLYQCYSYLSLSCCFLLLSVS